MNKIVRDSKYELMRIISMILIIVYHCIVHGRVLENCVNPTIKIFFEILEMITIVHVNSFVLVSGYYQSKSKFKQSKVWKLLNASLFYRITIYLLCLIFGVISFNIIECIKAFLYIDTREYWFLKIFVLLYLLSPFLNKFIKSLDKQTYKKLLILLFIILSIIPWFTGLETYANNGFTLGSFIFLYLVGAYFREYPVEESNLLKNKTKHAIQIICIIVFIFSFSFNYLLVKFGNSISNFNVVFNQISINLNNTYLAYSNPFTVVQTLAYFMFFGTLSIKNNFINKISSLVFGIYLIHDNSYMRCSIYKWLKIDNGPITSYKYILYFFGITMLIFIVCALIEYIRQLLFNFIYKWKISTNIRNKYYSYINSFKKNEIQKKNNWS